MQLTILQLSNFFDDSLREDLGVGGDVTSDSIITEDKEVSFVISARQDLVVCGTIVAKYFFDKHSSIKYKLHCSDGDSLKNGDLIISGSGSAKEILILERVVLNYLQHLSGISTTTARYVNTLRDLKASVCDTRKTIPGFRLLQKYAVKCGGGLNHRYSLDSGVLIKDNHIAIVGSVANAIKNARHNAPHLSRIEIECDTFEQVVEAVENGADIIMLDNMNLDQIKKCVDFIGDKAKTEVSGGVTFDSIRAIAEIGVDYISIGRLTHSVTAIDIGLDIGN
jgi:nicotinate-nucleotide pyrophosphorylase (carboxylating)